MLQVCGRVPKQYLEKSEVGYLRFFPPKTKLVESYVLFLAQKSEQNGGRCFRNSFS
jgi:hypothetical protein